jgi:predicted nucleotidyltransferase
MLERLNALPLFYNPKPATIFPLTFFPLRIIIISKMSAKERLKEIKETVGRTLKDNGVDAYNIYLFGSRAKGLEREDSDYDIIVVTHREFKGKEKFGLLRKIRRNIKYLGLSIDVILKSADEYRHAEDNFGSFIYSIRNEMVAI